jgi:hypothetical protein
MRGRALACAAHVVLWASVPFGSLTAQAARTRDAGISSVSYDNGFAATALTLNETLGLDRTRSSTSANGVVSLFDDGRWSMQGSLAGASFTPPIDVPKSFSDYFKSFRGELNTAVNSTAQSGSQPTVQLLGEARAHLMDLERGLWVGGGLAQTFDGEVWRTTMVGESGAWLRRGNALVTYSFRPMQLAYGDLLADTQGDLQWTHGAVTYNATLGLRIGQALRGHFGWVEMSTTFPVRKGLLATASAGTYPTDLLQALPGGRYASITMRVPTGHPPALSPSLIGEPPELATGGTLLTIATADVTKQTRVLRIRTAGATRVEVMGDFTDWLPITLLRSPTGVWETTVALPPGLHRLNVRMDGGEWIVPTNVARVTDEFNGVVGVIVVQ